MAAVAGDATDEMLMVRYQRGDRRAFAELVHRHGRPVYNFVLRQVRDADAAEDVTREAFLRIVRNAGEFKHEARFATWLYALTRQLCQEQLRRTPQRRPVAERHNLVSSPSERLEALPDVQRRAGAEASLQSRQVVSCVIQTVEALPEDQREVLLMREVAKLTFKDIAEITGAPDPTVKSRMRYALDRLREALSSFEEYTRALR